MGMYDLVVAGACVGALGLARSGAAAGRRVALLVRPGAGVPGWLARGVLREEAVGLVAGTGARAAQAIGELRARVWQRLEGWNRGLSGLSVASEGVDVYRGELRFLGYDAIWVEGVGRVEGRRFVVAPGTRPVAARVPGLVGAGVVDTETIWTSAEVGESVVILGGHPEAVEYAQVFASLGVRVALLVPTDWLLAGEDRALSALMERGLRLRGVDVRCGVRVTGASWRGGFWRVRYVMSGVERGEVEACGRLILVAAGREARAESLRLDVLGVRVAHGQGVEVDEGLRTQAVNVWAMGDGVDPWISEEGALVHAQVLHDVVVLGRRRRVECWDRLRELGTEPCFLGLGGVEAGGADELGVQRLFVPIEASRVGCHHVGEGGLAVWVTGGGRVVEAAACDAGARRLLGVLRAAVERGQRVEELARSSVPDPRLDLALRRLGALEPSRVRRARWFKGIVRELVGYLPEERPASAGLNRPHLGAWTWQGSERERVRGVEAGRGGGAVWKG